MEVMPTWEGCLSESAVLAGDLCAGGPLIATAHAQFIVLELRLPPFSEGLEAAAATLTGVVHSSSPQGEHQGSVHLLYGLHDNLTVPVGPEPELDIFMGARLNPFPSPLAPPAWAPISYDLDPTYLHSGEIIHIAISMDRASELRLGRGSFVLTVRLEHRATRASELIDDSLLADSGVRTLFPTTTGCRNLSREATTRNRCIHGNLYADGGPSDMDGYLRFDVPGRPEGWVSGDASLVLTVPPIPDAESSQTGELFRTTAFDAASLDTPGAANTPERLDLAAPDNGPRAVDWWDRAVFRLTGGQPSPGPLYLGLSTSISNAVMFYSHDAPVADPRQHPHLELRYLPEHSTGVTADIAVSVDPTATNPAAAPIDCTSPNTIVVDLEHEPAGMPRETYLRFPVPLDPAGGTVRFAWLQLSTCAAGACEGPSGEVWTIEPFSLADVSNAPVARVGSSPMVVDGGVIPADETILLRLPVDVVVPGSDLHLGLFPTSTNGVCYLDETSASPPTLLVFYE